MNNFKEKMVLVREPQQISAFLLRGAHTEAELVVGDHRGYPQPLPRRHYSELPAAEERQRGIGARPELFLVLKCSRMRKFADYPCRTRRCSGFLIAKSKQQTASCPICGHRSWVAGRIPIYSHRSLAVVKEIVAGLRGSQPAKFFLPVGRFAAWEKAAERRELDRKSDEIMRGWGEVRRRGEGDHV